MASTNQTAHYGLPQYAGTDRATWTDTNQPFEDVDTALYGATQDIGQAQSQILNLQLDVSAMQVSVSSMSADVELLKTDLAKENLIVLANKANIEALQARLAAQAEDTFGASVEETMEATKNYDEGDWISVNDALFVATASITSGDALVVGTNVASKTFKDLMEESTEANDLGTAVDISSYTSDKYTAPSDGYLDIVTLAGTTALVYVYGSTNDTNIISIDLAASESNATYIRKGMRVLVANVTGAPLIRFIPFA